MKTSKKLWLHGMLNHFWPCILFIFLCFFLCLQIGSLFDVQEGQDLCLVLLSEMLDMRHMWGSRKLDCCEVCPNFLSWLQHLIFQIGVRKIVVFIGVKKQLWN